MLIKLTKVSEALHRRIKALAAHEDLKIEDYVVGFLERNLPTKIDFNDTETDTKPQTPQPAPKQPRKSGH